jgi:hypothetical protein
MDKGQLTLNFASATPKHEKESLDEEQKIDK